MQKLRRRFTDDWYIIDGEDEKQRDQFFAQYLLKHMRQLPEHETEVKGKWQQAKIPESLLKPAQEKMDKAEYKKSSTNSVKKLPIPCALINVMW